MRLRPRMAQAVAVLVSLALAVPSEVASQGGSGQAAGQISRLIPSVKIDRGGKNIKATVQTPVEWQDQVETGKNGRARITLNDGSVLNVGADSQLRIVQHDAGAQQTQLDLAFGRVRSQAVKIARPGGKYEVKTPLGVAGVVGTDFYLAYVNGILTLIVYEGQVNFCNLAGQCVMVVAGLLSLIRGANLAPEQPASPTPSQLTEAAETTDVPDTPAGNQGRPHTGMNGWTIFFLALGVAAPAIAVPLARRGGSRSQGAIGKCPSGAQICP